MKKINVYFVDNGVTKIMTRREFNQYFGKEEGKEILAGYAPHIVAVELEA